MEDEPDSFDRSVQADVALGEPPVSRRWTLLFTTDEQGHAKTGFRKSAGEADPKTVTALPDAGYHTYEMRFHPATEGVDLLIDGEPVVQGYSGTANEHRLNRVAWGATSSPGTGYWRHVAFQIHADEGQAPPAKDAD